MEKTYEFTIGQKVKQWDEDENRMAFGEVVDKTSDKVFIKWDDMTDECEHERWEFPTIMLNNQKK